MSFQHYRHSTNASLVDLQRDFISYNQNEVKFCHYCYLDIALIMHIELTRKKIQVTIEKIMFDRNLSSNIPPFVIQLCIIKQYMLTSSWLNFITFELPTVVYLTIMIQNIRALIISYMNTWLGNIATETSGDFIFTSCPIKL